MSKDKIQYRSVDITIKNWSEAGIKDCYTANVNCYVNVVRIIPVELYRMADTEEKAVELVKEAIDDVLDKFEQE